MLIHWDMPGSRCNMNTYSSSNDIRGISYVTSALLFTVLNPIKLCPRSWEEWVCSTFNLTVSYLRNVEHLH